MTPTVAMGQLRRVTTFGVWRCPTCQATATTLAVFALEGEMMMHFGCGECSRALVHALMTPQPALEDL